MAAKNDTSALVEREEDLVQEAVDLIWREHGRVNGTPCYEAALRMLRCSRAAEERGRRGGVEEAQLAVDAVVAVCDAQQDLQYRNGALMAAEAVKALAPRDSGKDDRIGAYVEKGYSK